MFKSMVPDSLSSPGGLGQSVKVLDCPVVGASPQPPSSDLKEAMSSCLLVDSVLASSCSFCHLSAPAMAVRTQ